MGWGTHMGNGWWGFGGWYMGLMWIVILVFVGVLVWFLTRGQRPPGSGGEGSSSRAREILEERYARGEIDKDEFEQKKRDLHL